MPTIAQAIPIAIGSLLTLAAGGFAWRSFRRMFTWSSASGTVQRVEEESGRQGQRMFRPAVRFLTRDGREVSFLSEVATSHRGYRVGASVRVWYDAQDPERAEIASFSRLWLPVVALLFFAGAFFLVSRHI